MIPKKKPEGHRRYGSSLLFIKFLTLLSIAYCFNCPEGMNNLFHADVSSGCRVYHQCLSSELLTLTCPFGQAFDDQSIKCVDASLVDCIKKPSVVIEDLLTHLRTD
ncbi:hypothetical protein CEXT_609321 [Caerostris extrusa]|uniref:Chitin-binding type-2 domain-containing protein n=1 Tax=Caerostris extrusa TaxID=172846 RepID=A0AAV4Y713_CAEEX|nr:hypothetical protein CEXT_609321 [Caerostris extrusa]